MAGRAGAYWILNAESDAWPVIGPEILFSRRVYDSLT